MSKKLTKIQKFAKGKPCMLRIPLPGICITKPDNEDVVLCHAPFPNRGGMRKEHHWGAPGCTGCHDYVDSRINQMNEVINLYKIWMPAIHEWQSLLIEAGLMQVKGIEAQPPKILPRKTL